MNYTIVFTPTQIALIDKAPQALPYGQVVDLYLSIKNQIEEQNGLATESKTKSTIESENIGAD